MLKYLETNSTSLSPEVFINKFAGKKILVMGSGPSLNERCWQNIEVDSICTTSFFYLNDEIRSLKNISHITLSEIIDFNDDRLISFLDENQDCTIALEPKPGRPFYNSEVFKRFESKYRERLVYYNTQIDKKEGVAGRLCFFVMTFQPSELYYIGIDGKSKDHKNDPPNAFRTNIVGDADGYVYEDFLDSHKTFANAILSESKLNGARLFNLGEGLDYNLSSIVSIENFPLPNQIREIIERN
jgi:hypothetical protein